MGQCAYCRAETQTWAGGSPPICSACSDAEAVIRNQRSNPAVRTMLFENLISATARAECAREAFTTVTAGAPSGLPHPDGAQRITNVSRELAVAREKLMTAHHRLNDYLNRGVVPEDLKPDA
jgi:hypothetical protein